MSAAASTPTSILILGDLRVVGAGGAVQLREGLSLKLFAALAIRSPAPVSADALIEVLWGDRQPVDARNALQVLVSQLRRSLEPVRADVQIERSAGGYRVQRSESTVVDSVEFERLVRRLPALVDGEITTAVAERALTECDEALALWRGFPLVEVMYEEFALAEIARLRELHVMAHERRVAALLALGRDAEAVEVLQLLTGDYPLRESIWAALILALYRSRRQAEALRAYGRARELLLENLGVDPGPALRTLERRVLEQDPTLDLPAPADTPPAPAGTLPPGPGHARAVDAPRARFASRVPEPFSSLIGRGFELRHVIELLDQGRLVTLIGPGGVGKTRLAIEVARRAKERFPTRVIELGPLRAGADVALLIAAETGAPSLPHASPLDAVADLLGEQPTLLVFDTCEHIVEEVAAAASTLLRRNPNVRILATSRQPLGVAGETVWTVPPLDLADVGASALADVAVSDAVRLFVERARARRPGFELDDHNGALVAQICRALDGLPLAIELAAARAGLLSPSRIAERLDDLFALLSHGDRSAEPRQRSLRALIEWSHDLLSTQERVCFERLSVLAGSFDLDAAAAIAGDGLEGDPLDLLGALVSHSLVTSLDGDRFVLLDTLRAFAASRLAARPDDDNATHERHARWFLDVALTADPKSHGPLPGSWARLRADSPNLLAALEWFDTHGDTESLARLAGALAGFWVLETQIVLADRWLGRAAGASCADATMASVHRGIGVLQLYQSRFEESFAACERSVAHARRAGDQVLIASCLLTMGSALWGLGRFDDSQAALREAATIFERAGDDRGQGFALARLGRTLLSNDDPEALASLALARELLDRSGDGWMTCVAAEHTATALLRFGRDLEALAAAEEAVALGERVGSRAGRLTASLTLGRVLMAIGDLPRAGTVLGGAMADAVQSGNPGGIADAADLAVALAFVDGDAALAAEMLGAGTALRTARHVQVPVGAVEGRRALGREIEARLGPALFDDLQRRGAARDHRWLAEQFAA